MTVFDLKIFGINLNSQEGLGRVQKMFETILASIKLTTFWVRILISYGN